MPKLSDDQLKQLAEFTSNLGLVFLATAITPMFSEVDRVNPFMVALGLLLTTGFLVGSLLILGGDKHVKS